MYVMALATIPPFVGLLAMALLPNTSEYKWVKWGMYLITVPFVLALFLAWTLSILPPWIGLSSASCPLTS
jgi:ACS family allantoate permease-like MFS transporter